MHLKLTENGNTLAHDVHVGPNVMVYLTCAVIGLGGLGVIKT